MAQRRRHSDPATASWHVDKRIPLALIFTVGSQFAAFIFAYASLTADVRHVKELVTRVAEDAKETRSRLEVIPTIQVEVKFWSQQQKDLEALVTGLLQQQYRERGRHGSAQENSPTR